LKKPEIKYHESEIEQVFQRLISDWNELTDFYNKEVKFDFDDPSERLAYMDIGDIFRFIVEKKKSGKIENFEIFFENVEEIMIFGDDYAKNLILVGII